MARDWYINGVSMVWVRGRSNHSVIGAAPTQLCLAKDPVTVSLDLKQKGIHLDAWGNEDGPPAEIQTKLAGATISLNPIHFDPAVLEALVSESMGGSTTFGQLVGAGSTMGNNNVRFGTDNHYVSVYIGSPIVARPWRFFFGRMTSPSWPLGTEKSVVTITFEIIPYTPDPWGGSSGEGTTAGTGAANYALWDRNAGPTYAAETLT